MTISFVMNDPGVRCEVADADPLALHAPGIDTS